MRNVSLRMIIEDAYQLKRYTLTAPAWLDTERFDITAKVGESVKQEEMRQMLQSLLAERFQLKAQPRTEKKCRVTRCCRQVRWLQAEAAEGEGFPVSIRSRGSGKVKATCKHVSMARHAVIPSPAFDSSGRRPDG